MKVSIMFPLMLSVMVEGHQRDLCLIFSFHRSFLTPVGSISGATNASKGIRNEAPQQTQHGFRPLQLLLLQRETQREKR